MSNKTSVNPVELREQIKDTYREVAIDPRKGYHFHTGRPLAKKLGYDQAAVDALPDSAVESFAGVSNPFVMRAIQPGEKVIDAGAGAGFDSFIAAGLVGEQGQVVGVDMTEQMLSKSRETASQMGAENISFKQGLLEELPVDDGWADVVISNGVFNLCANKQTVFNEAYRVLRPGGVLQFADIANGNSVPEEARNNIDLWTA
ncbi:MAG: methyltransferase domain-containing protein [Arenicellaceae bacterium]|nr:methyltransferase domain-containing protein [Arenicellaceae bacterium]